MMRATNSITQRTLLDSIQSSYSLLTKYQKQVSNGKRINVPSDDAVGLFRVMEYSTDIAQAEQYVSNIDTALDEMQMTELVFGNMLDRLLQVKEIAVQAANPIYDDATRQMFASQVEEILIQIVDYSNTTVNDKYIFSGYATDTTSFTANYVAGLIDTVTYNGDAGQRSVEVNAGTQQVINYVGNNSADLAVPGVFVENNAPVRDIFTVLKDFRDNLIANDITAIRTSDAAAISQYVSYLRSLTGGIGVSIQELQLLQDSHNSNILYKKELKSSIEDVDAFEAMSNMSNQQVAYEAALRVGASIVQSTLFDFLS